VFSHSPESIFCITEGSGVHISAGSNIGHTVYVSADVAMAILDVVTMAAPPTLVAVMMMAMSSTT